MTKSKRTKKQKKDKKDKIHVSNKNNINIKINTGEKKTKRKYTKRETTHKAQFGNGAQYPHTQAIIPQPLPKPEPDYNALAREYLAPIPDRARRNLLIADGAPPAVRLPTPIVMNKVVKRTRRPPAINMNSYTDLMKLSFKDLKQLFKDEGVPAEGLKRFTKASQKPEAIREFLDHKAPQQQHSTPPRHVRFNDQDDDDDDDDSDDSSNASLVHPSNARSQVATTTRSAADSQSGTATSTNLSATVLKKGPGRPKGSSNKPKIDTSAKPAAGGGGGVAYMEGYGPDSTTATPARVRLPNYQVVPVSLSRPLVRRSASSQQQNQDHHFADLMPGINLSQYDVFVPSEDRQQH